MKQSSKQIFTVCLIKTRSLKNRNTLTLDTNTLLRNTKYFNKQLGMCCTQRWKAKLKDNVLLANLFSGLRMAVTTWLLLLPSLIVKPFGIIKLLDIDSLMIYIYIKQFLVKWKMVSTWALSWTYMWVKRWINNLSGRCVSTTLLQTEEVKSPFISIWWSNVETSLEE